MTCAPDLPGSRGKPLVEWQVMTLDGILGRNFVLRGFRHFLNGTWESFRRPWRILRSLKRVRGQWRVSHCVATGHYQWCPGKLQVSQGQPVNGKVS